MKRLRAASPFIAGPLTVCVALLLCDAPLHAETLRLKRHQQLKLQEVGRNLNVDPLWLTDPAQARARARHRAGTVRDAYAEAARRTDAARAAPVRAAVAQAEAAQRRPRIRELAATVEEARAYLSDLRDGAALDPRRAGTLAARLSDGKLVLEEDLEAERAAGGHRLGDTLTFGEHVLPRLDALIDELRAVTKQRRAVTAADRALQLFDGPAARRKSLQPSAAPIEEPDGSGPRVVPAVRKEPARSPQEFLRRTAMTLPLDHPVRHAMLLDADLEAERARHLTPRKSALMGPATAGVGLLMTDPGFLSAANPGAPVAADTAFTEDAPDHPELQALASQLGNDPFRIFEFVYNEMETQVYYGLRKGALGTLYERAGNDLDQAALLVALLRHAGFPARFEIGTVALNADVATALTRTATTVAASNTFLSAGVPSQAVRLSTGERKVLVEHAYVRAHLPYGAYRGAAGSRGKRAWVDLDPSFKPMKVLPPKASVAGEIVFDEDAYVLDADTRLPLEAYREAAWQAIRAGGDPCPTLKDARTQYQRIPLCCDMLPSTLPFTIEARLSSFQSVPAPMKAGITLRVPDAFFGAGSSANVSLAGAYGKVLALRWVGATAADQARLDAVTDVTQLSAQSVRVRAQFFLDNQTIGTSVGEWGLGEPFTLAVDMAIPGFPADSVSHLGFVTGGYHAVALQGGRIPMRVIENLEREKLARAEAGMRKEVVDEVELAITGLSYQAQISEAADDIFGLNGLWYLWDPFEALVTRKLRAVSMFGFVRSVEDASYNLDAPKNTVTPYGPDGEHALRIPLAFIWGINGSAMEHRIWEQRRQGTGVSAVKALQVAAAAGQSLFQVDRAADVNAALAQTTLDSDVKESIRSYVGAGYHAWFHRAPINHEGWQGAGYLLRHPQTGSGLYLISGSTHGGDLTAPRRPSFGGAGTCGGFSGPPGAGPLGGGGGGSGGGSGINPATGGNQHGPAPSGTAPGGRPGGPGPDSIGIHGANATSGQPGGGAAANGSGGAAANGSGGAAAGTGGAAAGSGGAAAGSSGAPTGTSTSTSAGGMGVPTEGSGGSGPMIGGTGITPVCQPNAPHPLHNPPPGYQGSIPDGTNTGPSTPMTCGTCSQPGMGFTACGIVSEFDAFLTFAADLSLITLHDAYTAPMIFTFEASTNTWRGPKGTNRSMTATSYGWKIQLLMGPELQFDRHGRLLLRSDTDPDFYVLRNDVSGCVVAVINVDTNQPMYLLEHNGNDHVLLDSSGNLVQVEADPATCDSMRIHNFADEITEFHYDSRGRCERAVDPGGGEYLYTYDDENRLISTTLPNGGRRTLTYDPLNLRTVYTDATGRTRVYSYDGAGVITAITDSEGATSSCAYSDDYQSLQVTNSRGSGPAEERTPEGLATRSTAPGGKDVTYERDAMGRIQRIVTSTGKEISVVRDGAGNVVSVVNAFGEVTDVDIDQNKHITRWSNASDGDVRLEYDDNGLLKAIRDPVRGDTLVTYDDAGRLTHVESAEGSVDLTNDALGRPTELRIDGQLVGTVQYDALGRIISKTTRGVTRTFSYDSTGLPTSAPTNHGGQRRLEYDDEGRVSRATDPFGNQTTFHYNSQGLLERVVDAEGNESGGVYCADEAVSCADCGAVPEDAVCAVVDADGLAREVLRNADGKVAETRLPGGGFVRHEYDANGALAALVDAMGHRMEYTYNALGLVETVRDTLGQLWRFEYNNQGRRTAAWDPRGKVTRFEYDSNGVLTARVDAMDRRLEFTTNALGLRTGRVNPDGTTIQVDHADGFRPTQTTLSDGRVFEMLYDSSGVLTGLRGPDGDVTFTRDAWGVGNGMRSAAINRGVRIDFDQGDRPSGYIEDDGFQVRYRYDRLNRPVRIDAGGAALDVSYTPAGRIEELRHSNGVTWRMLYDDAGRPGTLVVQRADGTVLFGESYTYDLADNLVQTRDANGALTTYRYDALRRLVESTSPRGTTSYAYDEIDNRTSKTVNGVTTTYTYDDASRLLSETTNGVTTTYTYDGRGNVLTRQTGSASEQYAWSVANRLLRYTAANGTVTRYGYAGDGTRLWKEVNGVRTYFLYTHNRLVADYSATGQILARYVYGPDHRPVAMWKDGQWTHLHLGYRSEIRVATGESGASLYTLAFTDDGAPLGPVVPRFGLSGMPYDAESGLAHHGARVMDPRIARFLSEDPAVQAEANADTVNRYRYAVNPIGYEDTSGLRGGAVGGRRYACRSGRCGEPRDYLPPPNYPDGSDVNDAIKEGGDKLLDHIGDPGDWFDPGDGPNGELSTCGRVLSTGGEYSFAGLKAAAMDKLRGEAADRITGFLGPWSFVLNGVDILVKAFALAAVPMFYINTRTYVAGAYILEDPDFMCDWALYAQGTPPILAFVFDDEASLKLALGGGGKYAQLGGAGERAIGGGSMCRLPRTDCPMPDLVCAPMTRIACNFLDEISSAPPEAVDMLRNIIAGTFIGYTNCSL